jgi:hypothetical protein
MDLNTGKKIVRRSWDIIPMTDLVTDRVNALVCYQPQHMTFTDRHRRIIGDIEIPGVDANEDDADPLPGVVPVIADDSDMHKMQFRLNKLRLMISTFLMMIPLQVR